MKRFFLIFFSALFLIGCAKERISEDIKFRVDVLYEHTLLMEEYSTPEMLAEIGLDMDQIKPTESLSTDKKISQLAAAYGLQVTGTYEEKIALLEKRMEEMMSEWRDLQVKP